MYFRFRKYDKEKMEYKLVSIIDVKDHDVLFKALTFMKDHECYDVIEINNDGIAESLDAEFYSIKDVGLCISAIGTDELVPCYVVDIE